MAETKEHLKDKSTWLRGLFMVLFAIFYGVAEVVVTVVVVIQFLFRLFTGDLNPRLLSFGYSLSTYMYEVLLYLTYRSEVRPFPFSDWPAPAAPPVSATPSEPAAGERSMPGSDQEPQERD